MSDPYNPPRPFYPSSPYGNRINPRTGKPQFHAGQDFAAPEGTPIPAATPGKVVYAGFNNGFGNTVIVQTSNGYSLYAHMKDGAPRAQLGQQIWPGDTVGQVGNTGSFSRGNHLHYSTITVGAPNQKDPNGGKIGVNVDKDHTVDPKTFDTGVRYLDQTLTAAPAMFGHNDTSDALTFGNRASPLAPHASRVPFDRLRLPEGNGSVADRFGNWSVSSPDGSVSSPLSETRPQGLPGLIMDHIQRQNQQAATKPPASVFDTGAPAVPFVPDDSEGSFADRFGDRPPIRRLSSRRERR